MTQLVYYVAPWDREHGSDDEAGQADEVRGRIFYGPGEIRHGFTLADLARLTRASLTVAHWYDLDPGDKYDAAWSAIAEHLCEAENPPAEHELIRAGWTAVSTFASEWMRTHGMSRDRSRPGLMPRFLQYWSVWHAESPERAVTESLALRQVLAQLRPIHTATLTALAECGDHQSAADQLGLPIETYRTRLSRARSAALALWHDHETPRKAWGHDVRGVERKDHRYLRRRSGKPGRPYVRITPEMAATAARMRGCGEQWADIALAVGASAAGIRQAVSRPKTIGKSR